MTGGAQRVRSCMQDFVCKLTAAWTAESAASDIGRDGEPHGQCAVTALVLQDYLGGDLLRCEIPGHGSHYWNLLNGIGELDLTRAQYPADTPIPRGVVVPRSRLLGGDRAVAARTAERYALLRSRVF